MRNLSGFRLCAHGLKVESYKWLNGSNVCDKFECAEVQDEILVSSNAIALRCMSCAENAMMFYWPVQALTCFCPASNHRQTLFLSCASL
eukprot:scaffold33080_cov15-Tisochrysis_lutea.AAC.1